MGIVKRSNPICRASHREPRDRIKGEFRDRRRTLGSVASHRATERSLVLAVADGSIHIAGEWVSDVLMKTAFAQKALAEGFPVEYIQARLGEMPAVQADNTTKIKSVLASELDINTKIAAASSMIKTATLSDADYSRLVDYWKNDLGYGDQEWIDALFTKKYDKKN